MSATFEIGAAPHNEECAQVGTEGFSRRNIAECKAFIGQLKRVFGEPPVGAAFIRKSNPHDFGTYREVAICVTPLGTLEEAETAFDYAYKVENDAPGAWDDAARAELREAGFEVAVTEG